eukprot:UN27977
MPMIFEMAVNLAEIILFFSEKMLSDAALGRLDKLLSNDYSDASRAFRDLYVSPLKSYTSMMTTLMSPGDDSEEDDDEIE